MSALLLEGLSGATNPEQMVERLRFKPGLVLLRSAFFDSPQARYSFLAVNPFLTFRCFGPRCEIHTGSRRHVQFGNPWRLLREWVSRYELLDEIDLPFPLGGCFGYWGYDLKNFTEPKLSCRARNDLEVPDCHVGFYGSLLVIDHRLDRSWIVSTGLAADGSRSEERARRELAWWKRQLSSQTDNLDRDSAPAGYQNPDRPQVSSNLSATAFIRNVETAQSYIRAGDIYQVNLSQRLATRQDLSSWDLFQCLNSVSPAPFAAYLDCGDFQIVSSSPEMFLRMSGAQIETRPIKGTRPRSADPTRDAQLAYDLQTSAKETAELVMITDLLRNDLGKVCEFGSVHTPALVRLERYPQVQHLVSTVEGRLLQNMGHLEAFAACFPGGSVTGAPKFRAMEIIDELEPTARGPYTGALGYLGFNRETQLSITIRTAICKKGTVYFPVGAGIVADSDPVAEYEETLAKARGFFQALQIDTGLVSGITEKASFPQPAPEEERGGPLPGHRDDCLP
jgi:para-aminobenzoate synthetase component 1